MKYQGKLLKIGPDNVVQEHCFQCKYWKRTLGKELGFRITQGTCDNPIEFSDDIYIRYSLPFWMTIDANSPSLPRKKYEKCFAFEKKIIQSRPGSEGTGK